MLLETQNKKKDIIYKIPLVLRNNNNIIIWWCAF